MVFIDGWIFVMSSSLGRYNLSMPFFANDKTVQDNALKPKVLENISIVNPSKKPIVNVQLSFIEIGNLINKYINIMGVAIPNMWILLNMETCKNTRMTNKNAILIIVFVIAVI